VICDVVLIGKYVHTFQRNLLPSTSGHFSLLKMDATTSFEKLVHIYQIIRRHIPHSIRHRHRSETF
jgi:hypothetical protein